MSLEDVHPARLHAPDGGADVLVLAADGEGAFAWARMLGARAAIVGLVSAGTGPGGEYDVKADPRAQAYLEHVDPPYFEAHMAYALDTVLPGAIEATGATRVVAFGCSNGAAFAASAALRRPEAFAGVLAFSLGAPPRPARGLPPHAFVSGRREPDFDEQTRRYARALRRRGVRVRHRRPDRGHEYEMWVKEFLPALAWVLGTAP
jgi:pimeloyl-ACP methyl ester carboxylesterase